MHVRNIQLLSPIVSIFFRPLSEEAVKYAREDTHFLLYIYDMMRNALIEAANGQTNLLKSVYSRSTELCKRRYVKSVLTEDGHMDMYRRSKKLFNNKQMYALEQIYRWRDKTARELDESVGYVKCVACIFVTLPKNFINFKFNCFSFYGI